MPTVFITGANRGLGLEFARQYSQAGWRVLAGCRHPDARSPLGELAGVEPYEVDVSREESIDALAAALADQEIDVLINNAGIYGSKVGDDGQSLQTQSLGMWSDVFQTNVFGPFAVTRALLPHLKSGSVVGILSSELGSMVKNTLGGIYAYRSSKAAVNMVGRSLAIDLKPHGVTVLLLHPGWAHTDMGGVNAPVNPVDSISGLRKVLAAATLETTGSFMAWSGEAMPW